MNLEPTPITPRQWRKVLKALYYSFASGFSTGFILGVSGVLGGGVSFGKSLAFAGLIGGVVGGLNALAVTIKQLFTEE